MRRGNLIAFDLSEVDGKIRTGVWDRFATVGYKQKDGSPADFTPENLSRFAANWYARGQRLPMCLDHASALQGMVPAPAAAFYDAMAVVSDGKVVDFKKLARSLADPPDVAQLQRQVMRFSTDESPSPVADGLWGYRCEVTPLGEDPTKGLRNYKGVSPLFRMDGTNEQEEPIGPVLFDVAAVNANFQGGCELTLTALAAPAGRPNLQKGDEVRLQDGKEATVKGISSPIVPGGQWQIQIEDDTGRFRWVDADEVRKMATNTGAARAFGERTMNEDLKKKMGLADGASAADRMAAYAKYAYEASDDEIKMMADDLDKDDDDKAKMMALKMRRMGAPPVQMDVDPSNKEQNAAIHLKTGNVHDEGGRKAGALSAQFSALAVKFGLPANASHEQVLTAVAAGSVPMSALPALIDERAKLQVSEALAKRDLEDKIDALALSATSARFPGDVEALKKFARTDFTAAEKMIQPFVEQQTILMGRLSTLTADRGAASTNDVRDEGGIIRFGLGLSGAIKAYRQKNPTVSYIDAADAVAKEQPQLVESYRNHGR